MHSTEVPNAALASCVGRPPKPTIPTQKRVTHQLSTHWAPFKALRQSYAGSRFEQQLRLHLPQKHKATEQDSALRVEMTGLEDQADNAKLRELGWKPLSWDSSADNSQ